MSLINENGLRDLAKSLLFENQINEKFMPDDFTNSRTTMYDRPGPQINGRENELGEEEQEVIIPLVADDFAPNTAYIRRDHRVRDDDDFCPENPAELSNALTSIIDDYKNEDDLSDKHIKGIWVSVKKILSKV